MSSVTGVVRSRKKLKNQHRRFLERFAVNKNDTEGIKRLCRRFNHDFRRQNLTVDADTMKRWMTAIQRMGEKKNRSASRSKPRKVSFHYRPAALARS